MADRMEEQRIKLRVKARDDARLCASRLTELANQNEPAARESFWDELAKQIAPHLHAVDVPTKPSLPMTDQECLQFERSTCPMGREHRGKPVAEVPLTWLDWLVGQERDKFILDAERYLANPGVSRRLEAAIDHDKREYAAKRNAGGGRKVGGKKWGT